MNSPKNVAVSRTFALAVVLSLIVVACGSDDGGDVRDLNGGGGSPSGSASASGTAEAECSPVNSDLTAEADSQIDIQASDYAFTPSAVEVETGVISFEMENAGAEAHELAFLPGGGEVPFTEGGHPDEDASAAAGAFELEAFGPGQTCSATYEIEPGDYTIFCIVETEDGTTHYELGMQGTLKVTG